MNARNWHKRSEYKRRHDNLARYIYWKLCTEHRIEREDKWYEHQPEGVMENENIKILWDMMIQCDRYIECRKPDIVVIDNKDKTCLIIDIAVPGDTRVRSKEEEKIEKYQELKEEIGKIWNMKKVIVIPVVVGALGVVTKNREMDREDWNRSESGTPTENSLIRNR